MGTADGVVELLTKRIAQGDYALTTLPTERQLAVEAGVSYMTARKAVRRLIDGGVLIRERGGKLRLSGHDGGRRVLRIAFLAPSFASADIERWRLALEAASRSVAAIVRPVLYVHWDDPLVRDSLGGFDGVFLVPNNEPLPERLRQRLRSVGSPVVILDEDWSSLGLPSIRLCPARLVARMVEHFAELGHHRIDCFNVQPRNAVISERIDHWWQAASELGVAGELIDLPIAPYERPLVQAHRVFTDRLAVGWRPSSALIGVTAPAGLGAIRALHDHHLMAGHDVAIGVMNGEGLADYCVPSLTAIELPDATPYFQRCLEWMASGGSWRGPLLMEPADAPLMVRESSGKSRVATPVSQEHLR
jgi:hypothetical protein